MRAHVVAVIITLLLAAPYVCACSCAPPAPGIHIDPKDTADVIFEGTVTSVKLRSPIIEALPGDLVSANLDEDHFAKMSVSLQVSRSYLGISSTEVEISTGVGGGDCGFDFEVGKQYLVFADFNEAGQLATGICKRTTLLKDGQTILAELRGGAPALKMPARHKLSSLEGKLIADLKSDPGTRKLFLVRQGSESPIPCDELKISEDGTFRNENINPGRYYLIFSSSIDESTTSFVYYPGKSKAADAQIIDLKPGESRLNLVFKILRQSTYKVSGNIQGIHKQWPPNTTVMLWRVDSSIMLPAYSAQVESDGSYLFPNVLPGNYASFVAVDDQSDNPLQWFTRKVALRVTGSDTRLDLELFSN